MKRCAECRQVAVEAMVVLSDPESSREDYTRAMRVICKLALGGSKAADVIPGVQARLATPDIEDEPTPEDVARYKAARRRGRASMAQPPDIGSDVPGGGAI